MNSQRTEVTFMSFDKLDLQSPNFTNGNIQKLADLFPHCVTETDSGKAIDFDLLKQELLPDVVEGNKERYRLEWPGKREAIVTANLPTNKTLRPIKEDSVDFDTTENLYIEGDNLEVLKLLQESYLGKIKMIYIDPPYNTGKDFVYKDNFTQNSEEYKQESGQVDENKLRLFQNPETSGRYHSDWLSMMYPRLKLARNLLTDDGVVFISIDDNEVHNLRKMCDEIFGEGNFVGEFVWAGGRKNDSKLVSVSHEYIICYVKSIEIYNQYKVTWREKKQGLNDIYKTYNQLKREYKDSVKTIEIKLKEWFKSLPGTHPAKNHKHYSCVDERGIYFPDNISWPGGGGPKYDVVHPITKRKVKIPSRGWMFSSQEKMNQIISENRVHFGDTENSVPCIKSYLSDREYSVPYSLFYKDGRASTKRLRLLLESNVFENPKDEEILKSIFEFTNTKDSIILDFFSGSATTAHAVLQLNAEDGSTGSPTGKRKFIMVQIPELTDEKSEAYKAGYKNICEIGKERIRRAGKKIKEGIVDSPNVEEEEDSEEEDSEKLDFSQVGGASRASATGLRSNQQPTANSQQPILVLQIQMSSKIFLRTWILGFAYYASIPAIFRMCITNHRSINRTNLNFILTM